MVDGITKFEVGFHSNIRKNYFLGSFGSLLNMKDDDDLIKDEKNLLTLNDAIKINQMVTTPIFDDGHFFNAKFKDKISGKDKIIKKLLIKEEETGYAKAFFPIEKDINLNNVCLL